MTSFQQEARSTNYTTTEGVVVVVGGGGDDAVINFIGHPHIQ